MTQWPAAPRVIVWCAGAVLLVGAVINLWGSLVIGVTVDETFHVVRLQNFFDHGWYLLDDDLRGGTPGEWVTDRFSYAPLTTVLLHSLNVAVGNESWGAPEVTAAAYRVRHLGIAVIGLVGVTGTVAVGRIVSGSWRWGVVAGGALTSLPMWTGHSMFNVKDVPVASGYTLVTLGCLLLLRLSGAAWTARTAAAVVLVCGSLLMIGTRPAMWIGLALALAALVGAPRRCAGSSRRRRLLEVLAVGGVTIAVLALVYPAVFSQPWSWLPGAVRDPGNTPMMRSRGALPFAVATTMPMLLLLVGGAGGLVRLATWLRSSGKASVSAASVVLVVLQAAAIPLAMILTAAAASGGLRHVLFSLPAMSVLLVAGMAQLLEDLSGRWGAVAGSTVVATALLLPTVAQAQLFPYGYGHANELAARAGLAAPDFWQASFAEYADALEVDDFVVCGFELWPDGTASRAMPNGGQSFLNLGDNCGAGPLSVLAPLRQDVVERGVSASFVALDVRGEAPEGCARIAQVSRARFLVRQVLSRAYRCPLVLPELSGGTGLDGTGIGHQFLLGGWSGSHGDTFVTVEARASLGFRAPGTPAGFEVVLEGDGSGPSQVYVNNRAARVRRVPSGWAVSVDDISPLGSSDNVAITVVAGDDPVRLTGFTLRAA